MKNKGTNVKNKAMKRTNIFYVALFCASTITIGCSSDNDDVIGNSVTTGEEIGLKTITVAPPTFTTDSKTRTEFTDNGTSMSIAWESGDQIGIACYNPNESTIGRTCKYENAGGNTFNEVSNTVWPNNNLEILIDGTTNSKQKYSEWKSASLGIASQTQAGNNKTGHIKTFYQAALLGVKLSSVGDVRFSKSWADANQYGGTKPSYDNTFIQSSVLKLNFTLPSSIKVSDVTKVELVATSAIFPTTNDGTGKTATYTLNFSDDTDETQNFVGYLVFPACDVDLSSKTVTYKVYVNDGTYIERSQTFGASAKLTAGTLNVIKITDASKWSHVWSFPTQLEFTASEVRNYYGLYLHVPSTVSYFQWKSSKDVEIGFGDGSSNSSSNFITIRYGVDLANKLGSCSVDDSAEARQNTFSLSTEKAGTLYVVVDNQNGNNYPLRIAFKGTSDSSYTVTETSDIDSKKAAALSYNVTGAGVIYLAGKTDYMGIAAIKFVPSN